MRRSTIIRKTRSRLAVIKAVKSVFAQIEEARNVRAVALNLEEGHSTVFILKEYLGSDCDYVDVSYDEKTDTLYGRPVLFNQDLRDICNFKKWTDKQKSRLSKKKRQEREEFEEFAEEWRGENGYNLLFAKKKSFDSNGMSVEVEAEDIGVYGVYSEYTNELIFDEDGNRVYYPRLAMLYGQITDQQVLPEQWNKYFDGLETESLVGADIEEIPSFIRFLKSDSLKDCTSSKQLSIPTELMIQLTNAGLKVEKDCFVSFNRLGPFIRKDKSYQEIHYIDDRNKNKGILYIDYMSFLAPNEKIRVYKDRMEIIDLENNTIIPFINKFKYGKFYKNSYEMLVSMMLAGYGVIVTSDVSLGLLDFYHDAKNRMD